MTETSRFRDLHTRTHEIELLISGALVFGLFQAPGAIDAAFQWWLLRVDGTTFRVATYLFVYSELLAYSLLGTFILHLCLRGYWAALLGLESVWPAGWDLAKLKFGPYGRQRMVTMVDSLSVSIDRTDDRASVVFAAGALLALVFMYSMVMVLVSVGGGFALSVLTSNRISAGAGLFVTGAFIVIPSMVVPLVDRWFGDKIPADTRTGRWFSAALGAVMRLSPMRWTGPVQFVFQTQLGERRVVVALLSAASIMAMVMVGGTVWRSGQFRVDGWTHFDSASATAQFDPRYYRNSLATRDGLLPSIDSELLAGPYLRLYLPYRPRRHNPLLATRCPQPGPASAACVGGLYKLSLGDRELTGLVFDFTRDMPSEFVGVVTFIDIRSLPAGRHELTITAPPRSTGEAQVIRIPFYRE